MRRFTRLGSPQLITDHWEEIGAQYTTRRADDPNYSFSWPQRKNQRINQVALPVLSQQTNDHCSYCDTFPLHRGSNTIDHFKPKTNPLYYSLVCQWENLYLTCTHCQDSKGVVYNDLLLRPDDSNFSFSHYFIYNYAEHKIEPNPSASDTDQARAKFTIDTFDFNYPSVKTSRRHAFERYQMANHPDINDFNYRFMFD